MHKRFWIGVLVLAIISGVLSQYRSTKEERYLGFVISKEYHPESTRIEQQGRDFPKFVKINIPEVYEITVRYDLFDREGNKTIINPNSF